MLRSSTLQNCPGYIDVGEWGFWHAVYERLCLCRVCCVGSVAIDPLIP
ncbi:hypothetical protein APHCRT_1315 [Anaplasma phagocytophilum str. CRT53-1]|uniref:Uncharacterized protein n=1 Tax=Anaplasma phagocytophilum str. CRT53-1 TaxID=1359157 RepID=A0A0F3PTX6_ANAPH|nr:hypothetical protein APHCRT_1315 [Anaplasma phagocytophilum str. CRT53-1]